MLELRTGSRLHFGLMELAPNQPLRYGGLGLMLRQPQLVVRLQARQPEVHRERVEPRSNTLDDEVQRRVQLTLARVLDQFSNSSASHVPADEKIARRHDFDIVVSEHPPLHCGLGCGTQLAAAVAAVVALRTQNVEASVESTTNSMANSSAKSLMTEMSRSGQQLSEVITPSELARLSGRGKRSGIGLHGFLYGGLIQDLGMTADMCESNGPQLNGPQLNCEERSTHNNHRLQPPSMPRTLKTTSEAFPDAWRVVLLTSRDSGDMHGTHEDRLIERAGQQPNPHRDEMLMLSQAVMSAARSTQFDAFTSALERYMDLASRLFSSVQAGRYRNAQVAEAVSTAQQAGLSAVGQSSWGPTVFGFAASHDAACDAASRLSNYTMRHGLETIVTEAATSGATWQATRYGIQHAS